MYTLKRCAHCVSSDTPLAATILTSCRPQWCKEERHALTLSHASRIKCALQVAQATVISTLSRELDTESHPAVRKYKPPSPIAWGNWQLLTVTVTAFWINTCWLDLPLAQGICSLCQSLLRSSEVMQACWLSLASFACVTSVPGDLTLCVPI